MSFNIPFKSGGVQRFMSKIIAVASNLNIKTTSNNTESDGGANFYSQGMSADFTGLDFETAQLTNVSDTLEQTIIDTGAGVSGVLTQIKSPAISAAGNITIRVTIDGKVTTFISEATANAQVMCVGDFAAWQASSVLASNSSGYGDAGNSGYNPINSNKLTMLTPKDSLFKGLPIGMVFKDSMKVTVQASVNFNAGSASNKGVAAWLNYIPEGIS